jgi:hypothetical protein
MKQTKRKISVTERTNLIWKLQLAVGNRESKKEKKKKKKKKECFKSQLIPAG